MHGHMNVKIHLVVLTYRDFKISLTRTVSRDSRQCGDRSYRSVEATRFGWQRCSLVLVSYWPHLKELLWVVFGVNCCTDFAKKMDMSSSYLVSA